MPLHGQLTQVEVRMLALEQGQYRNFGTKHQQVERILHMQPTEYYAKLNALIDTDEAMRWDPLTCKRLQRLREARRQQRSSARLRTV